MFTERHKELFTLYSMSIGYAELFKCKISIIFVKKLNKSKDKDRKTF